MACQGEDEKEASYLGTADVYLGRELQQDSHQEIHYTIRDLS